MDTLFLLCFGFVLGILFNVFWGYTLGLGYGIVAFRRSTADTLMMLLKNVRSVYEIQQVRYEMLKLAEREQKYIELQMYIDEKEMKSLKNTVIRNYLNSVPPKYNNMLEFHDWDSAMEYLNNFTKGSDND